MKKLPSLLALWAMTLFIPAISQAAIKTNVVEYKDGGSRFVGYLAYDDAIKERRPGVLVVHEWWGLNDYARQRARDIAALGYVAFAADMYGDGKSTEDPKQAEAWAGKVRGTPLMRKHVLAALKVLSKNKHVDDGRLGAIGFCFGGGAVLELAYTGANVAGVVSFHGNLPSPGEKEAGSIKAAILVLQGAEDPFVKPEEIAAFHKTLSDGKADWQLVEYGGVVHGYTNPNADKLGFKGVAYDEQAEHRAWQAMQDFFHERFSRK